MLLQLVSRRSWRASAPGVCLTNKQIHSHRQHQHNFLSLRHAHSSSALQSNDSSSSGNGNSPSPPMVLAYADGASRGNPGKSGCGALLINAESARVIASGTSYLGEHETNNSAEYKGLLLALHLAQTHRVERMHVHMDSELIIRQMQGVYRVKAPHLRGLFAECQRLCNAFESVTFSHVRREANADADKLANEAIDAHERAQQVQEQLDKQVQPQSES